MRVLSHRGWWTSTSEKNTESAFRRSFDAQCGTETDVRDMDGVLVISHDPPRSEASPLSFDAFLDIYVDSGAHDRGLPLALNDGRHLGAAKGTSPLVERDRVDDLHALEMRGERCTSRATTSALRSGVRLCALLRGGALEDPGQR